MNFDGNRSPSRARTETGDSSQSRSGRTQSNKSSAQPGEKARERVRTGSSAIRPGETSSPDISPRAKAAESGRQSPQQVAQREEALAELVEASEDHDAERLKGALANAKR